MSLLRSAIVDEARKWIGTPYRHQASVVEVGADCLGVVRGVWRGLMGTEPEKPPAYTPDWAETRGGSVSFDWTPPGGSPVRARFTEPMAWRATSARSFAVELTFEETR